jgi:hypothetical protein
MPVSVLKRKDMFGRTRTWYGADCPKCGWRADGFDTRSEASESMKRHNARKHAKR